MVDQQVVDRSGMTLMMGCHDAFWSRECRLLLGCAAVVEAMHIPQHNDSIQLCMRAAVRLSQDAVTA